MRLSAGAMPGAPFHAPSRHALAPAGWALLAGFLGKAGSVFRGLPVAVASLSDRLAVQPDLGRAEKRANVRERIAMHHQHIGPFSRLDGAEVCEPSAGFGGMAGAGDDDVHGG